MSYKVTIRNNQNGEVREINEDRSWEDHSHWFWTEGDYGCDCNRYVVWNDYQQEDEDPPCGHTLFTVQHVTLPTGEVIKIDSDIAKKAL
jgi:hypothetical protein